MNNVLLNTGVVVFIIYAAVSIAYQVSNYRTVVAVRQFITLSQGDLLAMLAELRATLENFRRISDNVTVVTEDVREVTSSVAKLQKEVKTLYGFIRDTAGAEARADFASLKAGIRTGVATLVKDLKKEEKEK
jgi:hypothetical protein